MLLSNLVPTRMSTCILLSCLAARASAYFIITEPTKSTQWLNGAANLVTWSKGLQDGIDTFDIELARLGRDGLTFIARDVPSKTKSVNIFPQDLPAGDDYFLLFINSTHGIMYATSPRFSILAASSSVSSNGSHPAPNPSVPTVTVSGAPNPTQAFATTFPALPNGVLRGWNILGGEGLGQMLALGGVTLGCTLGAVWTLW
jgi:hypothetical protein